MLVVPVKWEGEVICRCKDKLCIRRALTMPSGRMSIVTFRWCVQCIFSCHLLHAHYTTNALQRILHGPIATPDPDTGMQPLQSQTAGKGQEQEAHARSPLSACQQPTMPSTMISTRPVFGQRIGTQPITSYKARQFWYYNQVFVNFNMRDTQNTPL